MPKPIQSLLKDIVRFERYIVDCLLSRIDGVTPPHELRVIVGVKDARRYRAVGKEFLRYLKNLCALKPNGAVLDVGCGCGQVAAPLTKYLDQHGTYEGFDIDSTMIEWCVKNISFKYPNFHFQIADVFNKSYNTKGKYKASQYKFPYENESFDLIFLKSVFTHMLPQDMENYLSEISRTLKKNGRCVITYFLLYKESLESIEAKLSTQDFKYVFKDYRSTDETAHEKAVAYDKEYICRLYEKFDLVMAAPIYYGSWVKSIRKNFSGYHDMILVSKR